MNFAEAFSKKSTETLTENGALAYNTTDSAMLDFFSTCGALRSRQEYEIADKFAAAFNENPLLATKCAFYCGDIRGGLGERRTFKVVLKWLAENHPEVVRKNFHLVEEYNRWDSLYVLFGTSLESEVLEYLRKVIISDNLILGMLKEKAHISLLAKWLPSINTSSKATRALAKKICKAWDISEKEYRKLLSKLRAHLKIVEKKMSARAWNDIDFQSVPSYAMKKYRNAFKLKSEAFSDFMNKVKSGEQTIKADVLYPYDLVRSYIRGYGINSMTDDVIEAQWKALPDYLSGAESNVIVVADTSGSMFGCDRLPISSALGLAVYFAQRNKGAYHNLFMNFSSSPRFHKIPEESSLLSILQGVARADWGWSTNLESVFRQILSLAIEEGVSTEEMPKAVVVISDMEIDNCGSTDFVVAMEKLYESKGYKLPKLIFWNVDSRNDTFLTKDKNVLLVGGHATSTFKQLINSIDKTSFELMEDVLMSERYAPVTLA